MELTPNVVLVRRTLAVVAVALGALLVLALLSASFGREFVLAIDAANAAARAQIHDRTGQYKTALSEYYRLLELRPEDAAIRASLVELLVRRGEYDEALHHARNLIENPATTDRARDLSLYGDALAATGDESGAIDAYEKALALEPEFPDALYGLGVRAAMAGDADEARVYFARLKSAGLDSASSVYAKSMHGGEELDQRVQENPDEGRLSRYHTAKLIEWHLKHGRVEEAAAVYRASPRWTPRERGERAMAAVARLEALDS